MAEDMNTEVRLPDGKLLSDLRVKDLKKELRKHNLSCFGKKAELVMRLEKFVAVSELSRDIRSNQENTHPVMTEESTISIKNKPTSETEELYKGDSAFDQSTAVTTHSNLTSTPLCDKRSIINASYRKSSRHSKAKQSRGNVDESVKYEVGCTPTSKEARHSDDLNHAVGNGLENENPQELCCGCVGESSTLQMSCSREKRISTVVTPLSSSRNNLSQRPPQLNMSAVEAPGSLRQRGGVTAQTLSSAARSVQRKVSLSSNVNGSSSKDNFAKSRKSLPLSSRPIKKVAGNATEFFSQHHASIFAKMETISERQARLARRHEEMMRAVPNVVKRLATQKATRIPQRKDNASMERPKLVFDSSNVSTCVSGTSVNFGKAGDFRAKERQRDVRSRTKSTSKQRKADGFISVTVPVNNDFIDTLATPKGMTPKRPRGKVSYTPHRGAIGTFVDTTKLSDREFELAVANGLIKARSVRSSKQVEASHRNRSDDIIDVKRKLNIVQ